MSTESRENWLDETNFDVILLGTGLTESLVAGAAARIGKTVLHFDKNDFYGNYCTSFPFQTFDELLQHANSSSDASHNVAANLSGTVDIVTQSSLSLFNCERWCSEEPVDDAPSRQPGTASDMSVASEPSLSPASDPTAASAAVQEPAPQSAPSSTGDVPVDAAPAAIPASPTPRTVRDELMKESRRFNIDLSPKLYLSVGPELEMLVASGVHKYLEFKLGSNTYLYSDNGLQLVPSSKGDVFKSSLSLIEKRVLFKFISELRPDADAGTASTAIAPPVDMSFVEFLRQHKLNERLQSIVLNALAFACTNTAAPAMSAAEGVRRLQVYVDSIGKYGASPFLGILYGGSELPQAFCRLAAVYGGMYILRRSARQLFFSEDGKFEGIVDTEGQQLTSRFFVTGCDYLPGAADRDASCVISRAVCITSDSVVPDGGEQVLIVVPPGALGNTNAVYVLQLSGGMCVCPANKYLVHFVTVSDTSRRPTPTARGDLELVVQAVFNTALDPKPSVFYKAYFNQHARVPKSAGLPPNVFVCSDPDASLDTTRNFEEARRIFAQMFPGEEFLPKQPDPEELTWAPEPGADAPAQADAQASSSESGVGTTPADSVAEPVADSAAEPPR